MAELEQTLDSREVAEMVDKPHYELLKDMRRYTNQFNEGNLPCVEFFIESTYKDAKGETRPCYRITKKGCEFIAHKLTGTKGTIFTARYINRFHEMQDILSRQEMELELPWFIRRFRGRYIVLWRDFTEITGYDIENRKPRNWQSITPGNDWNGWGWRCDNDEFKKEYGFDYGTESCMMYFYPSGVIKVLRLLSEDKRVCLKPESREILMEGIRMIQGRRKPRVISQNKNSKDMCNENAALSVTIKTLPVDINIVLGQQ